MTHKESSSFDGDMVIGICLLIVAFMLGMFVESCDENSGSSRVSPRSAPRSSPTTRPPSKPAQTNIRTNMDLLQTRLSEVNICDKGMAAFENVLGSWMFIVEGANYVPASIVAGSNPVAIRPLHASLDSIQDVFQLASIPVDIVITQDQCDQIYEAWRNR